MDSPHVEHTRTELALPGTEKRHSFSKLITIPGDYKLNTSQLISLLCQRVTSNTTEVVAYLYVSSQDGVLSMRPFVATPETMDGLGFEFGTSKRFYSFSKPPDRLGSHPAS
jgi:hypothetical protein